MSFCTLFSLRYFSTTLSLNGKRNFRKFPLYNKRGTLEYKSEKKRADYDLGLKRPGYYADDDKFISIPEMIPELIVPDLSGFKLKPYVSYRVPDVVQSEFTAEDLFNACYTSKIVKDSKAGKLDSDGQPLEPSEEEKMTQEEAWIKARQTGSDIFCPDPIFKKKPEPDPFS